MWCSASDIGYSEAEHLPAEPSGCLRTTANTKAILYMSGDTTLPNVPHVYYMCFYFWCITHVIHTTIIHMFHM